MDDESNFNEVTDAMRMAGALELACLRRNGETNPDTIAAAIYMSMESARITGVGDSRTPEQVKADEGFQARATMRAKVRVGSSMPMLSNGVVSQELVYFHGVAKSDGYSKDGSDENNTFAKFSPSVQMNFVIANPALFGKLLPGDTFYCDFTPAPK